MGAELERDDALLLVGAGDGAAAMTLPGRRCVPMCSSILADARRRVEGRGKKNQWLDGGRTSWTGRRQRLILRLRVDTDHQGI